MKLIIDISEELYAKVPTLVNKGSMWIGDVLEAVKNGTPLEAQPTDALNQCFSCEHQIIDMFERCWYCKEGCIGWCEGKHWIAKQSNALECDNSALKRVGDVVSREAVDKRSLDSVIDTLQTWIKTADDEYDREEYWRVQGLWEALQEIKKIKTFESSTNLVDRDAVINLVKYSLCDLKRDADKQIFINTINSLPSVTPQRMQGEWIPIRNYQGLIVAYKCSKCEKIPKRRVKSNFCPNCGAEMSEDCGKQNL